MFKVGNAASLRGLAQHLQCVAAHLLVPGRVALAAKHAPKHRAASEGDGVARGVAASAARHFACEAAFFDGHFIARGVAAATSHAADCATCYRAAIFNDYLVACGRAVVAVTPVENLRPAAEVHLVLLGFCRIATSIAAIDMSRPAGAAYAQDVGGGGAGGVDAQAGGCCCVRKAARDFDVDPVAVHGDAVAGAAICADVVPDVSRVAHAASVERPRLRRNAGEQGGNQRTA